MKQPDGDQGSQRRSRFIAKGIRQCFEEWHEPLRQLQGCLGTAWAVGREEWLRHLLAQKANKRNIVKNTSEAL